MDFNLGVHNKTDCKTDNENIGNNKHQYLINHLSIYLSLCVPVCLSVYLSNHSTNQASIYSSKMTSYIHGSLLGSRMCGVLLPCLHGMVVRLRSNCLLSPFLTNWLSLSHIPNFHILLYQVFFMFSSQKFWEEPLAPTLLQMLRCIW
jgi:hypothetical protein